MSQHEEITRFSTNGKTFFFNKAEAQNDSVYLAINALYGQGNRERLVLFRPHMIDFRDHYDRAVEEILGMRPTEPGIAETCPDCGELPAGWRVLQTREGDKWCIICDSCREIIFENVKGALEAIKEEDNE